MPWVQMTQVPERSFPLSPPPRATWIALGLTLAGVALAWSYAFVSFLEVKQLALWAGIVALWGLGLAGGTPDSRGFRALAPAWAGLAALALLGLFVAAVPFFVLTEGLRIAALLLFASLAYPVLHGRRAETTVALILAGTALAAAVLALGQRAGWLEGLFPVFPQYDQAMYSVFGNQGLLGGYLAVGLTGLLGLPGAGGRVTTRGRTALMLLAALVLLAALLLTRSRGALIALGAGLGALLALRLRSPRQIALVAVAGLVVALVAEYVLGADILGRWSGLMGAGDTGGRVRPWIWGASFDMLAAHPLAGVGLGHYAYALPEFLGAYTLPLADDAALRTTYHAHFDLLEGLCETGVIGLCVLGWLLTRMRRRAPLALACLACLAVFSLFHPAWYSTPHALLAVLFAAMNLPSPGPARAPWPRGGTRLLTGAGVTAGCALFVACVLYPSFLLCRAEDRHLAGLPAAAAYQRAIAAPGFHPEAHEGYGIHAFEQKDYALAEQQFVAARRGINTGRIHALLAMTAAARGDRAGAIQWYRECLARWPDAAHIEARLAALTGAGEPPP